jgi:hypothetical protein
VAGRASEHFEVPGVELSTCDDRRTRENVLERGRPVFPVRRRFVLADAPDQALTKGLPVAPLRAAQRNGETEHSTLPRRSEDDLPVLPRRRHLTLQVGVEPRGVKHRRWG